MSDYISTNNTNADNEKGIQRIVLLDTCYVCLNSGFGGSARETLNHVGLAHVYGLVYERYNAERPQEEGISFC